MDCVISPCGCSPPSQYRTTSAQKTKVAAIIRILNPDNRPSFTPVETHPQKRVISGQSD